MSTNAPYSNQNINARLSTKIHGQDPARLSQDSTGSMVTNVSVVGGLFDEHLNFFDADEGTVVRSLTELKNAGIMLAPSINFYFYNLLAPLKNDFLEAALYDETAPQSEVVILCGICNVRNRGNIITRMDPRQRNVALKNFSYEEIYGDWDKGFRTSRIVSISPCQLEESSWPQAADAVNAPFVITRGGSLDEINSNDFLQGNFYSAAIPTEEDYAYACSSGGISGSLGFLVRNTDMAEIVKTVHPQHPLGRRMRALCP